MKRLNYLLIVLYILNNNNIILSVAGKLDKTFNPNGSKPGTLVRKILLSSQINSILVNQASKIIAAGNSIQNVSQFTIARFTADGKLDDNFNANGNFGPRKGIVRTLIGYTSVINAAALDNEGKIIACGTSRKTSAPNSLEQVTLARYNKNGSLDQTFNPNGNLGPRKGIVFKDLWVTSAAHAITIDNNEKIVIGGSIWNNNAGHNLAIMRFLKNGNFDATFNQNGTTPGVFSINIDSAVSRAMSIGIDSNNKIVAAGYSTLGFTIVRCNPNGTLDTTFNPNGDIPGVFTLSIGGNEISIARSIAIKANNKIYVTGTTEQGFTLLRLRSNGTLDTDFNPNGAIPGLVTTQINGSAAQSYSLALDSKNRILVNGFSSNNQKFTLARYLENGRLDVNFNANGNVPGVVITKIGDISNSFTSAFKNGKIIIAGNSDFKFAIARYLNN